MLRYYLTWYHIISYYTMIYHILLYLIMLYHIMLYHIILYCIISHHNSSTIRKIKWCSVCPCVRVFVYYSVYLYICVPVYIYIFVHVPACASIRTYVRANHQNIVERGAWTSYQPLFPSFVFSPFFLKSTHIQFIRPYSNSHDFFFVRSLHTSHY